MRVEKKVSRDLAQPKGEAFPDPNVDSIDSNETTHPQTKPATYSLEIPASSTFLSGISSARSISDPKQKRERETEVGNNLVNKQLEKPLTFAAWKINTWKRGHHFVQIIQHRLSTGELVRNGHQNRVVAWVMYG